MMKRLETLPSLTESLPAPPRRKSRSLPSSNRRPEKEPSKPAARSHRSFYTFFLIFMGFVVLTVGIVVGVGVGLFNQFLDDMPNISYLEDYQPWMPSRMFSGDTSRQLVADFFVEGQNREKVPLSDIPDNLINALISIEDYNFYQHPGISPRGFIRAAYYDIKNRNLKQGGSTITMQLAEDLIKYDRLDYELPEMGLKSFQQKIYEIFLALQIEKKFTKNEILEFYLNQVFMGGNLFGVAVAADYYFNKEISDLNLKECALFAGMQQRPNAYSPARNPEAAQKRTEIVLQAMMRRGYIDRRQYDEAVNAPFQLNTKGTRKTQIALYPYFSFAVRRQFVDKKIKTADEVPIDIYGRGIDIESTMNVAMQHAAEDALKQGVVKHEHTRRTNGGKHWGEPGYRGMNLRGPSSLIVDQQYDAKIISDYDPQTGAIQVSIPNVRNGQGPFLVPVNPDETWLDEFDILHKGYFIRVKTRQEGGDIRFQLANDDEYVQGALIAVRPSTGEILAQVGGYDFYDEKNAGQFIRTIQATSLQPGSAFKPLLYAAALADPKKRWTIASTLRDEEREYWSGWTPRNFYNQYYGNVTMLYSLTHSLNAASVWLLDNYMGTRARGITHFRQFCRSAFELPIEESNLSIALGTTGVTPLELAQAYSVLANEGNYVKLHMIDKVYQRQDRRKNSDLLYEFQQPLETQPRISPQAAYLTTYLLRSVVEEGTGEPAKDLPFYSVGKTGTTDDCTYAWYAGYSKDILCVVYVGFDDFKRSLGAKMTGSKVALPIWMDFMQRAYDIRPELFGVIEPPPGIVFQNLCAKSLKRASPKCPDVVMLPFEKGTEPQKECPLHGQKSLQPYRNDANQLLLSNQQLYDYDSLLLNVD
ncbi:MAG: transglycosylase domain-containing protein [Candidatus Omnitrophica bacterium]|nr:transglycosylase domain-containing protein [Candidatus Omnitrophota bacterium]